MEARTVLGIIKMILCNPEVKKWIEDQAAHTSTPIDNLAVKILYLLLGCGGRGAGEGK
jgi:hypothetical protein